MYNFDIEDMLAAYNGDPNALAQSFSDALNEHLNSTITPDERIHNIAEDLALFWSDYIHFYFEQKELPIDDHAFLEFTGDQIVKFTELLVTALPYIKTFMNNNSSLLNNILNRPS